MSEDPGGSGRLFRAGLEHSRERMGRWLRREAGALTPRRRHFRRDLLAGLPGAISSVPDGMASSVLAGVNPAHGLYASFAGPITGGLSSSTRLMVVTTTSAAALAAGSAISGYEGRARSDAMLMLTLLAGVLMLLAALAGLSRYIRFVSYSVMLGFLTGVAANMVLGQVPDLVGVEASGVAAQKAAYVVMHLGEIDWPSASAGGVALALLAVIGITRASVVSSLVALAVPTVGVAVFGASTVALVQDTGRIPHGLPAPGLPDLGVFSPTLFAGAAAVAALILVQGAGVAEAVPNPDGSKSSARRDFTAQGLANLGSGFFGGQPVGGSVGQTALNVTAGAASKWAAVWSGVWMAAILVAFSGLVGEVAMPTLAAVLVYAGVGAIHPREVFAVARAGIIPAIAMGATFASVLVLPVAAAVGVGVVASLLLQLNQEALDLRLVRLRRDDAGRMVEEKEPSSVGPDDVVVLDAYGSLFYAGARTLQRLLPPPRPGAAGAGPVVVLRLRGRATLGATFLKVIGDYARTLERAGGRMYLSGVDPALVIKWEADGTTHRLADMRIYPATPVLGESTASAMDAAHRVGVLSPPGS